eukprot:TRINITY_DN6565_c0_g1_i1.p1 TRINITY_DN6565_c0_g1~~TRINITY_DN6565_c0_g1_i1.p1  ORF type:complete len:232 (+),score=30.38 TRINITY_DN6565_c0_g1_i1:43-738(+)
MAKKKVKTQPVNKKEAVKAVKNQLSKEEKAQQLKDDTADIKGLFAGLKGKVKVNAKTSKAKTANEAPKPTDGKPYVSGPMKGYIVAGGNILKQKMTIEQAKRKALQLPACLGFTYIRKPDSNGALEIHFKNKFPSGPLEEPETSGWFSHKVENRVCLLSYKRATQQTFFYQTNKHIKQDSIAGSFMDLRGEGTTAKNRITSDGMAIFAADELTTDKGGFTKDCPFDCHCCF